VRIGIVTEEYDPWASPVASQVHHFAREARRLGHIVKVLTGDTSRLAPQPFRARGPGQGRVQALVPAAERDVIRVARSRPVLRRGGIGWVTGGLGAGRALREVLARERLDVVHVHSPLAPALPLLALHHATGPVVGTFHAPCAPGLWGRLLEGRVRRLLDRLDAAVVTARASLPGLPERIRGELQVIP
jgi:phosphatidyl-myo-inositol alpha-mannosyltransferase